MNPPSPYSEYSEDVLVEQPAITLFAELGWETANLYNEWTGAFSSEGRETQHEVVLNQRLRSALEKLNPDLPPSAVDLAIEELTHDRSKMGPVNANQEVYKLLKDGVRITYPDDKGENITEAVKVIDWGSPENNDFFLASQFWIKGDLYTRRSDLIGFVNGIPLVFIELKASHKNVKDAYDGNLRDYRVAVPQLFTPNGFVILSNGSETKVGSTFAGWEYFAEWKRIEDEDEEGQVSLEVAIRGTCTKGRLIDLIQNFIVFEEMRGGLVKKMAKYHQVLGVNKAIDAIESVGRNEGRLGVFWHTQGSGKSLSMVFYTQKVLRTHPGNWTFVIVTDRDELDGQIYKTFANTGAVTEPEDRCRAQSGQHLKAMLEEQHRYVFTLIQKFHTDPGTTYPKLSDRDDIIVITDEAHRSQYDIFALNMRNAMPKAAFLGFTGTPLMAGEEKTREVFGNYVSIYNFAQSIEDGATVRLFYENRVPELQLDNPSFDDDMCQIVEDADLDEDQERKLAQEFAREYHLITRDDRLDKIAEDIVTHFVGRGYLGKAMMISIDKATAVRMYDKVQERWATHLSDLKAMLLTAAEEEKEGIQAKINIMETTDMAVIVSQSQNEEVDMAEKGLDIVPHRRRMVNENLDEEFKKPDSPLRLVFLCAMWMTGFDVPTCSTIYLDKPMRNHTLMQTIARANRVAPGKEAGLIVDYANVFAELEKALAIYASPHGSGDHPIKDKTELVEALIEAIEALKVFCTGRGIDLAAIKAAQGFEKIGLLADAVEKLIDTEDTKKHFMQAAIRIAKLFKAILPDPAAIPLAPDAVLFSILAKKIRALSPPPDISAVMEQVGDLLDESILGFPIPDDGTPLLDISQIDFEKLKEKFDGTHKRSEVEKLRALLENKLTKMVRFNPSRIDFLEKFQRLIEEYNAGSKTIEALFNELMNLTQNLNEEEKRAVAENLEEEELAIFDILTKPEPTLTKKEEAEVKKVCKKILETLKREKLVLDWRTRQRTRSGVRRTIGIVLQELPDTYTQELCNQKCELAYQHIFDSYYGGGESVYAAA